MCYFSLVVAEMKVGADLFLLKCFDKQNQGNENVSPPPQPWNSFKKRVHECGLKIIKNCHTEYLKRYICVIGYISSQIMSTFSSFTINCVE